MMASSQVESRQLNHKHLCADLVVVGGGLAGLSAAVTAARAGISVILVQDRPILGGNASSEVRLWILGATAHMGNNNRWAREGGFLDEILIENVYRNPEGNPLILDTILLEKAVSEPRLTLLLNTAVYEVQKSSPDEIRSVNAFCSQNSTRYTLQAPLFCDASGDGIVGFLAGAAFRMGAEAASEFGEQFAPEREYGELLGHSLYFYSRDTGWPVKFVPPSFALKDVTQIPRWRAFNTREQGCQLWWIEFGGRLDTVHDTEEIKWELWKIVYGVWDHIKNSGQFPEAETLTLEWVGQIPGKRESRRFEGDYLLSQRDIVEQRQHADAICYGGWAIDLHPADGVYSELPGCQQYHSKGIYQIPYRSFYSRNINNLFLAGRVISATHVAFGSTRVMATCAAGGQAVGMAAAQCRKNNCSPRDLLQPDAMKELQRSLFRTGHHIPGVQIDDSDDLAAKAKLTASSSLSLEELSPIEEWVDLSSPRGILFPVPAGEMPQVSFRVRTRKPAALRAELRVCSRPESFTPDITLAKCERVLHCTSVSAVNSATGPHHGPNQYDSETMVDFEGLFEQVDFDFPVNFEQETYVTVCLFGTSDVQIQLSDHRLTGVLSVSHRMNSKVATAAVQNPPADLGIDSFEFWLPERRPHGKNLAVTFTPPIDVFQPDRVTYGPERPTQTANCWIADWEDDAPWLEFSWPSPQTLHTVTVCVDNDFDHPLESVLMGSPERTMPFCVPGITLLDERREVIGSVEENHQSRVQFDFSTPVTSRRLRIQLKRHSSGTPAALFRVRIF